MFKEIILRTILVITTTIVVYPISSIIADTLTTLWSTSLMNTIIITLIRYIGFFIGIGFIMFLYNGRTREVIQQPIQYGYQGEYK